MTLAQLDVLSDQRQRRRDILASAGELTAQQRDILLTVAALREALTDKAALDEPSLTSLKELLKIQLPAREKEPRWDARGHLVIDGTPRVPLGMDAVVTLTARLLPELTDDEYAALFAIARRSSSFVYQDVLVTLAAAGRQDPEPFNPFKGLSSQWLENLSAFTRLDWLVEPIAAAAPHVDLNLTEAWRLPWLCDVIENTEWFETEVADSSAQLSEPSESIQALIVARAFADGIELSRLGSEAQHFLEKSQADSRARSLLYTASLPRDRPTIRPLPEEVALRLAPVVASPSTWLSYQAARLLLDSRYGSVAKQLRDVQARNWYSQRNVALVRIGNAEDRIDEMALLLSGASAFRAAAALWLNDHPTDDTRYLLAQARDDEDGTVREEAGADGREILRATYWTCESCSHQNGMSHEACEACKSTPFHSRRVEALRSQTGTVGSA